MLFLEITDTTGALLSRQSLIAADLTEGVFGRGRLAAEFQNHASVGSQYTEQAIFNSMIIKPWRRVKLVIEPDTGNFITLWHGWITEISHHTETTKLTCVGAAEYLKRKIISVSQNYNTAPLSQIIEQQWNQISSRNATNITIACPENTPIDIQIHRGMSMFSLLTTIQNLGYEWRHDAPFLSIGAQVGADHTTSGTAIRYDYQNTTSKTVFCPIVHNINGKNTYNYIVGVGGQAIPTAESMATIAATDEEIGTHIRTDAVNNYTLQSETDSFLSNTKTPQESWHFRLSDVFDLYTYRPHDAVSTHINTGFSATSTTQKMRITERNITLDQNGLTGSLTTTPNAHAFQTTESLTERINRLELTN